MKDISVILSVDDHHLNELSLSWQTWFKFKSKEFNSFKEFVIMFDKTQLNENDNRFDFLRGYNVKLVPWPDKNELFLDQRSKMLTSLVYAPYFVETDWYIKIDTDTIASNNKKWIFDDWFTGEYKFISNPWGYTKPSNAIQILDDWGDNVDDLSKHDRLNFPFEDNSKRVCHKRIISWLFVCDTDWSTYAAKLAEKYYGESILPIPSQDTYLYYIAERTKQKYKRVKFKKFGWHHISRYKKLKDRYREIMNNA